MIIKKHVSQEGKLILAVCDDDLIGKKFTEGNKNLDLSSEFYKGEQKDEGEVISLLKKAYIINAVGKHSLACCIKAGLIDEDSKEVISKIPCANLVML